MPKVNLDGVTGTAESDKLSYASSQSQLNKQQTPRGGLAESGYQSYKERRDQHKSKIADKAAESQVVNEPQHSKQYKDIISRIEKNLQNVKQVTPPVNELVVKKPWESIDEQVETPRENAYRSKTSNVSPTISISNFPNRLSKSTNASALPKKTAKKMMTCNP